jgi:hypothetical protein
VGFEDFRAEPSERNSGKAKVPGGSSVAGRELVSGDRLGGGLRKRFLSAQDYRYFNSAGGSTGPCVAWICAAAVRSEPASGTLPVCSGVVLSMCSDMTVLRSWDG